MFIRVAAAMVLAGAAWLVTRPAAALPAGIASPDHGVVCNPQRTICYDRFDPSIGLTEAFLGQAAAERLTAALRERPLDPAPGAVFSPADGVDCAREMGPCRVGGQPDAELTAVLYGPRPQARELDTEARPAEPSRYTLRLEPDGSVQLRADCNGAGGRYRIEGSGITIEVTSSTMAACEPGSLDRVFLRDLPAAALYFTRGGRLYLDLKFDTGTMEFAR